MTDKPKVLVVDDEAHNRRLLESILAAEGHAVRCASSGEEALSSAAEQPPDLILLDIMMPDIDGFEVARRLKAEAATRAIPIIMVTALEDRQSRMRALQAGAEDFLSKPVDPAELLVRVRNLLRLKEYGDFLADHNRILEQQVRERTAALASTNRLLRMLLAGNQALVRATSEEELMRTAVRNIVENGGYRLARISYAEDDPEKSLTRMASAGAGDDFYPEDVRLTWADTDGGQVPVARAIRSGAAQVCHDIATDPGFAPWKDAALARGYAANIAMPLSDGSRIFGGLSIYSEVNAFGEEEIGLLKELAEDIAYGIASLRTQAALQAAEEDLRLSEERLRQSIETARDAIVTVDGEGGKVIVWNPAAEALFGYGKEEAIGRGIHELLPSPRFREAARAGMAHFARTGEGAAIGKTLELVALHRDGTEFPVELSLSAMQVHGKWQAIGIARDISVRKQHEAEIGRLNAALRLLSACNVALVHAKTEEELFRSVCRQIVETGGYRLAWVEYPHGAGEAPRVGAHAGDEAAFRRHAELATRPEHVDHCLAAIALRTRQTEVCNDFNEMPECAFGPLREVGVEAILALPLLHDDEIHGVLTVFSSAADAFGAAEIRLAEELAGDLAYGIVTLRTRTERDEGAVNLRQALEETIAAIALTLEKRDPYTAGHQQRVAGLAAAIAAEMGLPQRQIEGIHFGALIHDIGKVYVPAEILNRPGKLSELEFGLIKTHPQVGYDIVRDIPFPWPVAQMVHQHHERQDGSGYPQGLKGEAITIEARILAVADVVEAMSSHRPYRAALGIEAGLAEIERLRGAHFDAAAADACLRLFRERGYRLEI